MNEKMEKLLERLDEINSQGSLDEYQRGVFDTLSWLLFGNDAPFIEND